MAVVHLIIVALLMIGLIIGITLIVAHLMMVVALGVIGSII